MWKLCSKDERFVQRVWTVLRLPFSHSNRKQSVAAKHTFFQLRFCNPKKVTWSACDSFSKRYLDQQGQQRSHPSQSLQLKGRRIWLVEAKFLGNSPKECTLCSQEPRPQFLTRWVVIKMNIVKLGLLCPYSGIIGQFTRKMPYTPTCVNKPVARWNDWCDLFSVLP